MAALNQDKARLRREVNAAAAPEAGRTGVERPLAAPLGSFAPAPELGGDGDGAVRQGPGSGNGIAADLRRELAAAAEVERLRGLLAAAAATSATREAELAAELEAQVREGYWCFRYPRGSLDLCPRNCSVAHVPTSSSASAALTSPP